MLLPPGAAPEARLLLIGRALRAFTDGFVAILLPVYLLALGLGKWEVGLISTATLFGSALATLAVGQWGYRFPQRRLLLAAAWLMVATGLLLAGLGGIGAFWPLLIVAFVGTMNPSSGDVSVFLPLEQARLAESAQGEARTFLFARYTFVGALCAATGSLATVIPQVLTDAGMAQLDALRLMFVAYGLTGVVIFVLYRALPDHRVHAQAAPVPLGPSRGIVIKLAALFSVDAFAGGLIVNTLLALWLFERFDLSLAAAGQFFFWAGLLSAGSQLAAPWVARHIGLINTMVFTHIPSSVCLILAAFADSLPVALALLFLRSALSQMDVPTRSAFVMAVVTPAERAAAASFTAVPRSLAAAASPAIGGALFAAGWLAAPLLACGLLKIAYDVALWRAFRKYEEPSS
ncbi:TPA: MFS transporter [Pseudomonas aeruginosa]|uniref:MFS transporter n=1 Tax=Pseudomonas aeruginosa TaxID=287 RepID=UPI00208FC1FA|nr:MFS transporter [Pseudomonas aeruginosa]HCF0298100.1 MFS transporter [Pseudomonas aeruginosa]HCL4114455.1 MFS transporter [Pseudomonas aeruginosa]HEJ1494273.1 MFS transporter [Pseudomonas aeruginosa]HEJ3862010.1 MFS transporter [Pseudomonas aeruginosa]